MRALVQTWGSSGKLDSVHFLEDPRKAVWEVFMMQGLPFKDLQKVTREQEDLHAVATKVEVISVLPLTLWDTRQVPHPLGSQFSFLYIEVSALMAWENGTPRVEDTSLKQEILMRNFSFLITQTPT